MSGTQPYRTTKKTLIMSKTGQQTPAIPTTAKGFKIFPRKDITWTCEHQTNLRSALRKWTQSLQPTSEFLTEWKPTLSLHQLEIPNNYHIILNNISSKEIRMSLQELLINLKNKNIIMPREGMIMQQPHKMDVYLDLSNNTKTALQALLTGYLSDHETFSTSSTNIRLLHQTKILLEEQIPTMLKEDELLSKALQEFEKPKPTLSPLKTTPQKKKQDFLQNVFDQIQLDNWEQLPPTSKESDEENNLPPQKR